MEYDRNECYTPEGVIAGVREVLGGLELDPASCEDANKVVRASRYYTKENDGLSLPWDARTVFLNPPYKPAPVLWVDKFIREVHWTPDRRGILIVNNCTDTEWFRTLVRTQMPFCLTKRIKFNMRDRPEAVSPRQGQAIFYSGPYEDDFYRVFSLWGVVCEAL